MAEDHKLSRQGIGRRVDQLKAFYKHVVMYVLFNLFLICFSYYRIISFTVLGDFKLTNRVELPENDQCPLWLFWGGFLVVHALIVFAYPVLFGTQWQQKKFQRILKESSKQKEYI